MTTSRILVCDDEAMIGRALQRTLARQGVEVVIETDSAALEAARACQPRAILIDLLQRRDGLVLLRELKADPHTRDIPAIVMSSLFVGDEPPERLCHGAIALGAMAVVAKPLPEGFLSALARFVKRPLRTSTVAAG